MRVLLSLGLAFILVLVVERLLSSPRVNKWYLKRCLKQLDKVPKEHQQKVINWLKDNISVSTTKEIKWKDVVGEMPVQLRHKLTENKLRAYMSIINIQTISDCWLDPDYYAIEFKDWSDK